MTAKIPNNLVVGLGTDLEPAGWLTIWRSPGELRLNAAARKLLAGEPGDTVIPEPLAPTPHKALDRAVARFVAGEPSLFKRRLANKDWAIVRQDEAQPDERDAGGEPVHFEVLFTATVSIIGTLDVVHTRVDDATPDREQKLADLFAQALVTIAPPDVSAWLARHVFAAAQATPLKTSSGGAYFVPSIPSCKSVLFRAKAALVAAGSPTIITLPAYNDDPALVGAILDSLTDEATRMVEQIRADGLGSRALANRQSAVKALRAKIDKFAALLERDASTLLNALDECDAAIAAGLITGTASST